MFPMKDERFHITNHTEVWQAAVLASFEEVQELELEMGGSLKAFADDASDEDRYNLVQLHLSVLLREVGGVERLDS